MACDNPLSTLAIEVFPLRVRLADPASRPSGASATRFSRSDPDRPRASQEGIPDSFGHEPSPKPLDLGEVLAQSAPASTLPKLEEALTSPSVPAVDAVNLPVPAALLETIEKAQTILVVSHTVTDHDAVGSTLALARALKAMGKQVDICIDSDLNHSMRTLDASHEVRRSRDLKDGHWDLAIVADVAQASRIGGATELLERAAKTALVDHHEPSANEPPVKGDRWVVPDCDAACMMVAAIVAHLDARGAKFSPEQWVQIGLPIAAGMLTDTGWFQYSDNEALSVQVFKHLLSERIGQGLASMKSLLEQHLPVLLQAALGPKPAGERETYDRAFSPGFEQVKFGPLRPEIRTLGDGSIGVLAIPSKFYETGKLIGQLEDSEFNGSDMKDFLSRLYEPAVRERFPLSILATEAKDGKAVACSIRSHGDGKALALATFLGGGGHANAAGAKVYGTTLDQLVAKVEAWALGTGVDPDGAGAEPDQYPT